MTQPWLGNEKTMGVHVSPVEILSWAAHWWGMFICTYQHIDYMHVSLVADGANPQGCPCDLFIKVAVIDRRLAIRNFHFRHT